LKRPRVYKKFEFLEDPPEEFGVGRHVNEPFGEQGHGVSIDD